MTGGSSEPELFGRKSVVEEPLVFCGHQFETVTQLLDFGYDHIGLLKPVVGVAPGQDLGKFHLSRTRKQSIFGDHSELIRELSFLSAFSFLALPTFSTVSIRQ